MDGNDLTNLVDNINPAASHLNGLTHKKTMITKLVDDCDEAASGKDQEGHKTCKDLEACVSFRGH